MPWFKKNPDLTNDPTYLEPRITANDIKIGILEQISLNIKKAGGVGDYNTSTGSGTDETTVIQNALNGLSSGDTLVMTRGNYKITGQVTVPDGVDIVFTKKAKVYVTAGAVGFLLGNDCTLKNPKIYETRAYSTVPNQTVGVKADGKTNVEINGGVIDKFTFANLYIGNCTNAKIRNVELSWAGTKSTNVVEGKSASNAWEGQGLYITGDSKTVKVTGCHIHDNGKHGIQGWSTGTSIRDLIATNNHCLNNGDIGIYLRQSINYIVTDNHCHGNGVNGGPYGGQGIQVTTADNSDNPGIIKNNHCHDNKENGIELIRSKKVIVEGNVCLRNTWNGIKGSAQQSDPCKDVILGNNILMNNGTNGIEFLDSLNIKSNGNITKFNTEHGERYINNTVVTVSNPTAANNGQGYADRSGIHFANGFKNYILGGVVYDDQATPTQTYGVRFYNVNTGAVKNVERFGNITKGIQVGDGSVDIDQGVKSYTAATVNGGGSAGSYTPSLSNGILQKLQFTGCSSFTFNNPTNGLPGDLVLQVSNGNSSTAIAPAFGTAYKMSITPASLPVGKKSLYRFVTFDGSEWALAGCTENY